MNPIDLLYGLQKLVKGKNPVGKEGGTLTLLHANREGGAQRLTCFRETKSGKENVEKCPKR